MKESSHHLLNRAKNEGFAIPAMNFIDYSMARSYLEVAEKQNLPLILAFAQVHSAYLSLEEAAVIGKFFRDKATTPVVLHLDHGQDINFIRKAIELGFNSVMIDASQKTFEENVRLTQEVVRYAHENHVDVEAEIGFVGTNQNNNNSGQESIYTEVEDAKRFVDLTGVDSLAVSIGTAHGLYKGSPHINFERLNELASSLPVPLVLHGGSGTGDENLRRASQEGIAKINIYTDVIEKGKDILAKMDYQSLDYPSIRKSVESGMGEILAHYYEVFGTKGE